MSDTIPADVALVLRLGPIGSPRRQRRYAGSDVPVWCDILDRITADPVTDAAEFSGLYWPPDSDPEEADGQPLTVEEVSPGVLHAMVPGVIPGSYAVSFRIGLPIIQTGGVTFDVASDATGHLVVGAAIPWSSIQAAAAAMGASAGAAEARVVGGTAGAVAGAAAGTTAGAAAASGRIASNATIAGNVITETVAGVTVTTTIAGGVITAVHGAPVNETWRTTIGGGSISTVRIA